MKIPRYLASAQQTTLNGLMALLHQRYALLSGRYVLKLRRYLHINVVVNIALSCKVKILLISTYLEI